MSKKAACEMYLYYLIYLKKLAKASDNLAFKQKKHVLGEDIIRNCAAEVLISHSMIQTMKPTVHLTIAKLQHRDKSSSSESDSDIVDASSDKNDDESIWSTAF